MPVAASAAAAPASAALSDTAERLEIAALAALPGIRHGFFTRRGGLSTGLYAGLNCGTGSSDDPALIAANRARAANALGVPAGQLITPYQVHGPEVAVATAAWASGSGPKADAVVTDRPGLAVGIGIADCTPVLFADPVARVVGAAHAGWRGASSGVLDNTIAAMERLGARRARIIAAYGPAIAQESYETGPEFLARFLALDPANARYFTPSDKPGHHRFDLPAYVRDRLGALGLAVVAGLPLDTYADEARFYSCRRSAHRGEPDYGRMIAAIVLTAD